MRTFVLIFALLGLLGLTQGCNDEGAAEKAGKKIDETFEKAKDAFQDATD